MPQNSETCLYLYTTCIMSIPIPLASLDTRTQRVLVCGNTCHQLSRQGNGSQQTVKGNNAMFTGNYCSTPGRCHIIQPYRTHAHTLTHTHTHVTEPIVGTDTKNATSESRPTVNCCRILHTCSSIPCTTLQFKALLNQGDL